MKNNFTRFHINKTAEKLIHSDSPGSTNPNIMKSTSLNPVRQLVLLLTVILITVCAGNVQAQSVGISNGAITPDASSIMEIRTTTKGLLIPRMTTTERDAISSPATGLMVYNTTTNKFNFYSGSAWTVLSTGSSSVSTVTGTTNRITIGGTASDPTIDIAATYPGQTSITTLGTIGTGTWNGTVIGSSYGGAGTVNGMMKANGSGTVSSATSGTDYSAGTSALATGILKSTTTTGALSIAVAGDFPTLNQNTTGSAATLTTSRNIYGNAFNGSAALTQVIASTYGGTGNGFAKLSGPATTEKTFTLPNANATILTDNAAVTVAQGGTGQTSYTDGQLLIGNSTGNTLSKATLTAGSGITVTNGGGTITIAATGGGGSGTVTSASVVSANGFAGSVANATTTPAITLTTSVTGLIKGNGTALSAAAAGTDYVIPSGSVATLTTSRNIYGNAFNGSADVTGIIASTYGGTGNGFTKFSGPATAEKTFTLPNASATILTDNAAVTVAQGGTGNTSYTIGDINYASGATTLSKLSDVSTGNVLLSGGLSTAPSYGKVGLTTHITGILPVANGGTNSSASLNGNRIMVSGGGSINESTALTNGQLLIGSTSAAPVVANLTAGNGITITNGAGSITIANEPSITQVTSTSDVTTSSTSDVLLTGMTVTPGAGDYLVTFTGSYENTNSNKQGPISIYVNGVQVAASIVQMAGPGNTANPTATQAYVTGLGAGQAIEVKWKVIANTGTFHQRTMIVQKVK